MMAMLLRIFNRLIREFSSKSAQVRGADLTREEKTERTKGERELGIDAGVS